MARLSQRPSPSCAKGRRQNKQFLCFGYLCTALPLSGISVQAHAASHDGGSCCGKHHLGWSRKDTPVKWPYPEPPQWYHSLVIPAEPSGFTENIWEAAGSSVAVEHSVTWTLCDMNSLLHELTYSPLLRRCAGCGCWNVISVLQVENFIVLRYYWAAFLTKLKVQLHVCLLAHRVVLRAGIRNARNSL